MTDWTDERHAEAKARCNAATEGPWIFDPRVGCSAVYSGPDRNCLATEEPFIAYESGKWIKSDGLAGGHWTVDPEHTSNHDFIAHARVDLPDALAEIEGLQAENARLREYANHVGGCPQYGLRHGETEPRPCDCGWERVKESLR